MTLYRQLAPAEWHMLEPEFAARGVPLPSPQFAVIFAAFDHHNRLRGFLVCQYKMHTEPMVSYDAMLVPGLMAYAESKLVSLGLGGIECYVSATAERTQKLAKAVGFTEAEPMFVKRLETASNNVTNPDGVIQ